MIEAKGAPDSNVANLYHVQAFCENTWREVGSCKEKQDVECVSATVNVQGVFLEFV